MSSQITIPQSHFQISPVRQAKLNLQCNFPIYFSPFFIDSLILSPFMGSRTINASSCNLLNEAASSASHQDFLIYLTFLVGRLELLK